MKQIILGVIIISIMACNGTATKEPAKADQQKPAITDTSKPKVLDDTAKKLQTNGPLPIANTAAVHVANNVAYYYKKYANVDSEDPGIGVGPRTIIETDLKSGIITYKDSDNKIDVIKVWNTPNYDIVDYPGGVIMVQGKTEIVPNITIEAGKYIEKIISNRTARGGECKYSSNPYIVAGPRVSIELRCNDDESFRQTVGYVDIKNGKMIITEK